MAERRFDDMLRAAEGKYVTLTTQGGTHFRGTLTAVRQGSGTYGSNVLYYQLVDDARTHILSPWARIISLSFRGDIDARG